MHTWMVACRWYRLNEDCLFDNYVPGLKVRNVSKSFKNMQEVSFLSFSYADGICKGLQNTSRSSGMSKTQNCDQRYMGQTQRSIETKGEYGLP